jgi:hypothetical protein
MAVDSINPAAPPKSLMVAVRSLLGPLVRLLMRYQVTFPSLAELLKQIYVEEARDHFALGGKPLSDSRIHVLTGVHRKDIRRFKQTADACDEVPPAVSLAGQLIARWTADPRYAGPEQSPVSLPRRTDDGSPSFESLVAEVCRQDVRAKPVLDELLRLGVVDVVDDTIRLKMEAFIPEDGLDEKCYYLGRNVHDHLAAAVHNVAGGTPPFPERSVYYSGLTTEAVDELSGIAAQAGTDLLQRINRRAHELKHGDGNGQGHERMNFGLFFFRDQDANNGDGDENV